MNSYRLFRNGWFSKHIPVVVCLIAACQALLSFSMLMRGLLFRTGAIGGMIFLVAIAPLGREAVFPCSLIMARQVSDFFCEREMIISGSEPLTDQIRFSRSEWSVWFGKNLFCY